MRREIFIRLAFIFVLACVPVHAGTKTKKTKPGGPLAGSRQVILVTTPDWNSVKGTLRRFERKSAGANWTQVGEAFEIVVGRSGLGWGAGIIRTEGEGPTKHEGDGRAPAGVFHLTRAFGFASAGDASALRMPYLPLTPTTECVDDTASAQYNRVVDRAGVKAVDWNSSERMREVKGYAWGVIVAHNERAVPGQGSCIFLHIWAGPEKGTAGCTAMERPNLETLLGWLDSRKQPLLVQLPEAEYARLQTPWRLPAARAH